MMVIDILADIGSTLSLVVGKVVRKIWRSFRLRNIRSEARWHGLLFGIDNDLTKGDVWPD